LPRPTQEAFEARTGAVIVEGYGLTETSPVTHCNPIRGSRKSGSIGLPLPDTDARVVDPQDPDRELPPGEAGELQIKGPQVMRGYWNRPEETARSFHGEWLRTGDLATIDQDGYFRIVGRDKDMIKSSGYKIHPDEIDEVLHEHPAVLESCTIGLPDAKRGESVKSFVVLRPGVRASEEELVRHCRENLAPYKVPRRVEFRMELPRSPMMKLLRRVLREEEIGRGGS
jgi:long-chain acyl-CoA synthetase